MRVVVGPVESASALAFADFAEETLAERGDTLTADVREAFVGYLAEWRSLGATGTHIEWQTDVEVELGEYLILAFYRLAQQVDASRPTEELAVPPAASPFYQALVSGLLAAMADAGSAAAEFSEHLRGFWPGQAED